MSLDPKSLNAIRLVRDRTSGSSRSLTGSITPRWMSLMLPLVGKHRGWIDHVVERVLCEIIDAYRVKGNGTKPFWDGSAYRIDRRDLSTRFDCKLRHISQALTFLEKRGFVILFHKARFYQGEPKGTMVFAIPEIHAIDEALIRAEDRANQLDNNAGEEAVTTDESIAKAPENGTQPADVGPSVKLKSGTQPCDHRPQSLNVPPTAHNDAEDNGGRQAAHPSSSQQRRLPPTVVEGGGAAFISGSTPEPEDTTAIAHDGQAISKPFSGKRAWCSSLTTGGCSTGEGTLNVPTPTESFSEFPYDETNNESSFGARCPLWQVAGLHPARLTRPSRRRY